MTIPDTISRLDDGLPVSPADLAVLAIAERHASDQWAVMDVQLDRQAGAVCSICGGEVVRDDETAECDRCTAGWDVRIARTADL